MVDGAFGRVRRDFLRWVAFTSLFDAPIVSNAAATRWLHYPFAMGVASGTPTASGVVLWTRLSGMASGVDAGDIPVHWEIWEPGARSTIVAKGVETARSQLGHSVHVEVEGLRANRWYEYRFFVRGAESPLGRTRTLPAADHLTQTLRFAYASCQSWEDGHYAAYRRMVQDHPDLVLFLGDYIYEYRSSSNPDKVRRHGFAHAASLQDFRDRYALYRSDPLLQQMHACCPWLLTWDDHEVENNYAGELSAEGRVAELPARRLAAYQAYYENMPLSRKVLRRGVGGLLANDPLRLHTAVNFGQLARFFVLDNRQYRDTPPCGFSTNPNLLAVCDGQQQRNRSMLGQEQEAWLDGELGGSLARWNVVAQQTLFTPVDYLSSPDRRGGTDTWAGFPHARQRLIDGLVRSKVRNPLILGGDIHQNWVAHVHQDPYDVSSRVVAAEFCGTSITSPKAQTPEATARQVKRNPHCVYSNAAYRGYGLVDITPKSATVSLRAVSDVRDANSEVFELKRFEVEAGSSQIKVTL